MNTLDEIQAAVKAFDDLHEKIREFNELYQAQISYMSKSTSLGYDADLARVQRIIISIRRDLEKARGGT